MPLNLLRYTKHGRVYEDTDRRTQVYRSRMHEENVLDTTDGKHKPFIHNRGNKSIKHGVIELEWVYTDDEFEQIHVQGFVAVQEVKFFVQVWNDQTQDWEDRPHGAPFRTIQEDHPEQGIVTYTLDFPEATEYVLQINYELGRKEPGIIAFTYTPNQNERVRFQWQLNGLHRKGVGDFEYLTQDGGHPDYFVEPRIIGIQFEYMQFAWLYTEADKREVIATRKGNRYDLTLIFGPYDLTADETLEVRPDIWQSVGEPTEHGVEVGRGNLWEGQGLWNAWMTQGIFNTDFHETAYRWEDITIPTESDMVAGTPGINGCFIEIPDVDPGYNNQGEIGNLNLEEMTDADGPELIAGGPLPSTRTYYPITTPWSLLDPASGQQFSPDFAPMFQQVIDSTFWSENSPVLFHWITTRDPATNNAAWWMRVPSAPILNLEFQPGGIGPTPVTETLSIDALVSSIGLTQTVDLDALLQSSAIVNVSIDAIIASLRTIQANIDAQLFEQFASGTTIDGILQRLGIQTSLSIDALIQAAGISQTADLDAVLAATSAEVVSIDALINRNDVITSLNLDAIIGSAGELTLSLDAMIQDIRSQSANIDAFLSQTDLTIDSNIDAFLQSIGAQVTVSLDSILKAFDVQRAISLDAIIGAPGLFGTQLDAALLQTGLTRQSSLDAMLRAGAEISVSIDAVLQTIGITTPVSIDAVLQTADLTEITSLDAYLSRQNIIITASIDAILQGAGVSQTNLDALIVQPGTGFELVNLDAVLLETGITITADLDALLSISQLSGISIDAVITSATGLTVALDAMIQSRLTQSLLTDALLLREDIEETTVIDALLNRTRQATTLLDARITKQWAVSTLDALLQQSLINSLQLDALFYQRQIRTASLDAIVQGIISRYSNLDALLQTTAAIPTLMDAIIYTALAVGTPKHLFLSFAQKRKFIQDRGRIHFKHIPDM